MGDAIISRRGGATLQALAPTITEVSTDVGEIVFTITNNDPATAVIVYETNDTLPDQNGIELAGNTTSGNLSITGLSVSPAILYASANIVGKVKSNITEKSFTFTPIVYTVATGGTTEEYDLSGKRYRSHTFTSNGTFTVTTVGDAIDDRNKVDYLIIAGGGNGVGGQSNFIGGAGGGAGGYLTTIAPTPSDQLPNTKATITQTSFSITVGGPTGNSSAFSISATGGGGGGFMGSGSNGGSGGGGGTRNGSSPGGSGILGQGRNGGNGVVTTANAGSGGGGGAGGIGGNAGQNGGGGGAGLPSLIRTGSNETLSVGGTGGDAFGGAAQPATANTGNGGNGGGGNPISSGTGGASGIVIIRYEIAPN